MKNRRLKRFLFVLLIIVFLFFVWINLPLSVRNFSKISLGNKLVENIEKYKSLNSKLPNNQDWKTLEALDFQMTNLSTNPEYNKVNENDYKLIFVEGFDRPYLTYNSKTKDWSIE